MSGYSARGKYCGEVSSGCGGRSVRLFTHSGAHKEAHENVLSCLCLFFPSRILAHEMVLLTFRASANSINPLHTQRCGSRIN